MGRKTLIRSRIDFEAGAHLRIRRWDPKWKGRLKFQARLAQITFKLFSVFKMQRSQAGAARAFQVQLPVVDKDALFRGVLA